MTFLVFVYQAKLFPLSVQVMSGHKDVTISLHHSPDTRDTVTNDRVTVVTMMRVWQSPFLINLCQTAIIAANESSIEH